MGTMNFSIPDAVKDAFNEVFKDENKSAIIAQFMQRAIEQRKLRDELQRNDKSFRERVLRRRAEGPRITDDEIRAAREELRK
jgi:hypothetical protein